jgi:hypothetical protein
VFDLDRTDRLTKWKEFRDSIEFSDRPLKDVAEFWSQAPFVSSYLNPNNPAEWPDPWHLVLDLHLDDLAITLGMLYTLKLTQRFMDSSFEIHTSMFQEKKDPRYFLVVDNKHVLNLEYKDVVDIEQIKRIKTNIIWSTNDVL